MIECIACNTPVFTKNNTARIFSGKIKKSTSNSLHLQHIKTIT